MFKFIKNIFCCEKARKFKPDTEADELVFLLIEKTEFLGTYIRNDEDTINLRHTLPMDVFHVFHNDNTFYVICGVDAYDYDGVMYKRSLHRIYKLETDIKNFCDTAFNDYICINNNIRIRTGVDYFSEFVKNHKNNVYYNKSGNKVSVINDKKILLDEIDIIKKSNKAEINEQ